jgi:hypothetical protein
VEGLGVKAAKVGDALLRLRYSQEEFANFLLALDFDYDRGYGGQELFGIIWYEDGTWSDRSEYDGSEWWTHHECPAIPASLWRDSSAD